MPWTIACQTPLSMGFFRQEYWSRLPFPPPGDLIDPGTEPMSLASPALAGRFYTIAYSYSYTYSIHIHIPILFIFIYLFYSYTYSIHIHIHISILFIYLFYSYSYTYSIHIPILYRSIPPGKLITNFIIHFYRNLNG